MKSLLSSEIQQSVRHCFVSCFNHMNSEETTRPVTGRQQVWSKWLVPLFTDNLKVLLFFKSHLHVSIWECEKEEACTTLPRPLPSCCRSYNHSPPSSWFCCRFGRISSDHGFILNPLRAEEASANLIWKYVCSAFCSVQSLSSTFWFLNVD